MKKFIFAIAAIMATPIAYAQSGISPVYVFTHSEDTDHQSCKISLVSATAAVKAALRYNRIEILGKPDSNGLSAFFFISTLYLKSFDLCATSVRISFYKTAFMPITTGERSISGDMEFCSQSSILTQGPSNAQARVNSSLRELVDMCVSEIETKLKK